MAAGREAISDEPTFAWPRHHSKALNDSALSDCYANVDRGNGNTTYNVPRNNVPHNYPPSLQFST